MNPNRGTNILEGSLDKTEDSIRIDAYALTDEIVDLALKLCELQFERDVKREAANSSAKEYSTKGSKETDSEEFKHLVEDRIEYEASEVRFADIKARSDKLRILQKQLSSKQEEELKNSRKLQLPTTRYM